MDQSIERLDVLMLSEEDWGHVDALASKYNLETIHKAFSQYERQSQSPIPSVSSEKVTVGRNSSSSTTSSTSETDTCFSIATTLVPQATSTSSERFYFCTYHHEFGGLPPYFRKKGDCKAHMMNFHNLGKEWTCPMCHWVFDRDHDFHRHCRFDHPRQPLPPITDIVTALLPKQVFACGFQGCESLFSLWDEWFDHITNHMRNGLNPSHWQYSLVIANLLRQTSVREVWEHFLFQAYSTEQPPLEWTPSTSRKLCQKLECKDFRPGINYLVQAAHYLGRPRSESTNSIPPPALQFCLRTPSCDSVPLYRDHEQLDEILMRSVGINLPLQPSANRSPLSTCSTIVDLDEPNVGFQGPQSMPITRRFDPEGEISTVNSSPFSDYTQDPIYPFPHFAGTYLDESFSTILDPLPPTFDPNIVTHSSITNTSTQPQQPLHILQQLNYFDYDRFVRAHTPCPLDNIS